MKRWIYTLLILGGGCLMVLLGVYTEGRRQLLLQGLAVMLGAPVYYFHGPGGNNSTKLPPLSLIVVVVMFTLLLIALCMR